MPAINALIAKAFAAGYLTDAELEAITEAVNALNVSTVRNILLAAYARNRS